MFLFLSPSGNNEDVRFFFLGLKCRKAKSVTNIEAVAVPIEDSRRWGGIPLILTIRPRVHRTNVVLAS